MYYDLTQFINGIQMPTFNDIIFNVLEKPKINPPIIVDENINQQSLSDQYFESQIKEAKTIKESQQKIAEMPLEERIRYESQQRFLKDKSIENLDYEQRKLDEFKRTKQIYNELKELTSERSLNYYGITEPTLQNPFLNLNDFIQQLSGKVTDFENPETQNLLKILYRYINKDAYTGVLPLTIKNKVLHLLLMKEEMNKEDLRILKRKKEHQNQQKKEYFQM
jgi:hypothetical protein